MRKKTSLATRFLSSSVPPPLNPNSRKVNAIFSHVKPIHIYSNRIFAKKKDRHLVDKWKKGMYSATAIPPLKRLRNQKQWQMEVRTRWVGLEVGCFGMRWQTAVATRKLKLLLCDRDKNNINRCGILTLFVGDQCLLKADDFIWWNDRFWWPSSLRWDFGEMLKNAKWVSVRSVLNFRGWRRSYTATTETVIIAHVCVVLGQRKRSFRQHWNINFV